MINRHILIVDDAPGMTFLLSRVLERSNQNYKVTSAYSGEDALEVLKHYPVDLLVTDLHMPGISGLELISWVRTSSPQTRTILMTGCDSDETRAEARYLGVSHHMTKPFATDRFIKVVQETLYPSSAEQALSEGQRQRELLISLIFHELRMPLTFIMGYVDPLAEQSEGPCQEWAHTIQRHALRMREVLDDVTLMMAWNVSQDPGYLETVDLRCILSKVIAQLVWLTKERHQTLQFAPTPEPIRVTADTWLLGVLLNTFVASVIKCMPERAQICVSTKQEDGKVMVTVVGNGGARSAEGIANNERGIGLALVRNLTEALGGELLLASDQDDAVFRLSFPTGSHPSDRAQAQQIANVPQVQTFTKRALQRTQNGKGILLSKKV